MGGPFERFLGQVAKGQASLAEAFALLRKAQAKNEQAQEELRGATEGTSNDKVDDSIAYLEDVGSALDEALARGLGGLEALHEYLRLIYAEGAIRSGSEAPAPKSSDAVPPTWEPLRLKNFRSGREHADAVQSIRDLPRVINRDGNTSARAHLYDPEGTRMGDDPYEPGSPNDHPVWDDLHDEWNRPERTNTSWHVEGRMARQIRDSGLQEAAVYLNIPVCGAPTVANGERPNPKGCWENFRHIIPEGTVVYVYVVPERGVARRRKFVGTGKGIKGGNA